MLVYPQSPTTQVSRGGFSLVLSLLVMATITLLVISLASFLTVESRLVSQHQLAVRARLNALVSLRLALAHLQQEAGPDRRITARADITANTTQAKKTWADMLNPLWTGVWRSDLQLQPPAWLVSGRHDKTPGCQSASLVGESDYYIDQQVPWQSDYSIPLAYLVPLVGNASATGPELPTPTTCGKPEGRISLARVPLPDTNTTGSFCYWIGDEGVKARINLRDTRLAPTTGTTTAALQQAALRGTARAGVELITGLQNVPLAGLNQRITQFKELPFLPATEVVETTPASVYKRLSTETTLWARGVNADSLWGGLKIDLSLAFEMTDAEWKASEFGEGTPPKDSGGVNLLSGVSYTYSTTGLANNTSSTLKPFSDVKIPLRHDGIVRKITTIYAPTNPTLTTGIRGPTWEALRNYHRLYKELDWSDPVQPILKARAHFPNSVSLNASGYSANSHYGHIYNRADVTDTKVDFMNLDNLLGRPAPRITKPGVFPYVARQLIAWGIQQNGGGVNLTFNPITVLHNPHNVTLKLAKINASDTAAARLSFRGWESLRLTFSKPDPTDATRPPIVWTRTISELAQRVDGGVNSIEAFRANFSPDTLLLPGEFRVFGYPALSTFKRLPGNMSAGFEFLGGFTLPCTDDRGFPLVLDDKDLTIALENNGVFEARFLIDSWPGDRVDESDNSSLAAAYNKCSEANTLYVGDLRRSGLPSPRTFTLANPPPMADQQPTPIGIFDYGVRWPKDPMPFLPFSHSNPMAPVTRVDASGTGTAALLVGFGASTPSYRMAIRSANSLSEVLETYASGTLSYGGMSRSLGLGGVPSAVYVEIPLVAPVTLAQYAHANINLRDQDPLYQTGHSFAPLNAPLNSPSRSSGGVTSWDHAWMMNSALFDRFFLSGAAPVIIRGTTITESKSLSVVLDEFANGTGNLSNPRTILYPSRDPATMRSMVGNPRRIGGTILTEGTFNVNSTSVEAWLALLASAKRNAMGKATESLPATTQNARFPRAVRADAADYNYKKPFKDAAAWTGLATYDDAQLRVLAKAIVDEIRGRIPYNHRYTYGLKPALDVHYQIKNRGVVVPLPFISLAQFVNRFNCGAYPAVSYQGCLQNAILRADIDGGATNGNLSNRTTNAAPGFSGLDLDALNTDPNTDPTVAGLVPYTTVPDNVVAEDIRSSGKNRAHTARGSPAALTQADILEAVGSALATRSDTFVIRCYGDVTDPLNPERSLANAWLEAIVQRAPEFCDASQPPEMEVCGAANGQLHNSLLSNINKTLGRRFQLISIRALTLKEL